MGPPSVPLPAPPLWVPATLNSNVALNCVNNYKYTQYFKDVNFFIDPCAHDGGTYLGAVLWYDNYR